MKGISAVIAIILMLVITIALAGSAYMFISGIFTARTGKAISIVDAYCVDGTATITIRNDGTQNIAAGEITFSSINEACDTDPTGPAITAGSTATATASGCQVGRTHVYRAVGPANSQTVTFMC